MAVVPFTPKHTRKGWRQPIGIAHHDAAPGERVVVLMRSAGRELGSSPIAWDVAAAPIVAQDLLMHANQLTWPETLRLVIRHRLRRR